MKKVLLVLSTSGTSEEAIDSAVNRAKKDGVTLVALYLLEKGLASEISEKFTDIGFIGDKPSTELSESIMTQQRQSGYEELGRVQIKAMEEGVGFEPLMEEGDPVSTVLSLIKSMEISTVVLVKRRQKAIFKYFSRSLADDIKEKAPCEVVVIEEQ
ncbi:MAG: universal stress protein [Deltaproteobacteria bacterium]|nr:universal stress protein [Deltaproteobacteria bacterium]